MKNKAPEHQQHRRILYFNGVANFRDLGGYLTEDGRMVQWGRLFRSGHLGDLKKRDLPRFSALNICTLVDFRSIYEQERHPDSLPQPNNIRTLSLPVLDLLNANLFKETDRRIRAREYDDYDPEAAMLEMYSKFPTEGQEQYRTFVHEVLAAEGKPVLWHCTAGKDRAGFASAILLRLLGVPENQVIKDYLLSHWYLDRRRFDLFLLWVVRGKQAIRLVRTFLQVRQEWIETALRSIDRTWGDFEAYSREALQMSPADIQTLRSQLLTEA